ncbi:exodeoxyribonuclease I, partial [Pseudomonas syringae]
MTSSIFWYDDDTTGSNPRDDRARQMAGIRTDTDLKEIAAPVNLRCQLSDDILPHPAACMITGITPATLVEKGLCEADCMTRVHAELSAPGTCGAGYNTLRFDDEVTRYSFYRNFSVPSAREWPGCNRRWAPIVVARAAYAVRREGSGCP